MELQDNTFPDDHTREETPNMIPYAFVEEFKKGGTTVFMHNFLSQVPALGHTFPVTPFAVNLSQPSDFTTLPLECITELEN